MVDNTIEALPEQGNLNCCGIYSIRNTVSDRVYVGSSQNIGQRWYHHKHKLKRGNHHAKILQRSWNIHGPDAFLFEILEVVDGVDRLFEREQYWMDTLSSYGGDKGFNGYPAAGSPRGHKWSDSMRAAASLLRKGVKRRPHSAQALKRMSLIKLGKRHTLEARLKMSVSRKSVPLTKQHRSRVIAAVTLRNKSPEMRRVTTLRNQSPEMRKVTALRNMTRLIADPRQVSFDF